MGKISIDFNSGIKLWGQETQYQTYLKKFADAYEHAAKSIGQSVAEDDYDAARALAHKLKGVAGNLALPAVMAEAGRLESLLSSKQCNNESVAALQTAVAEACASIRQWPNDRCEAQPDKDPATHAEKQADLQILLTQLLEALQMNNPDYAEPLLGKLKGILSDPDHEQIVAYLANYDFPGAHQLVTTWLNRLKF